MGDSSKPYASLEDVRLNDALVHQIMRSGGTLEQCVIALATQKRDLLKRICDLELIAPRKMTFPDGSVRIYRAPDYLVPDSCK